MVLRYATFAMEGRINMKSSFETFMKKVKEFEDSHEKAVNTTVYEWFNNWALPMLQIYVDDTDAELFYDIKETEIKVKIKYNESRILLCCPYDCMVKIMSISSDTWVTADESGLILEMTFHTVYWKKKENK